MWYVPNRVYLLYNTHHVLGTAEGGVRCECGHDFFCIVSG
jgi:hypothetical protein